MLSKSKTRIAGVLLVLLVSMPYLATAQTQDQPNILVIWGDDLGHDNISAYHRGMMGGSTPNIDRIANEGALFTDAYAQQSCTAGRASFMLGQNPFRTGLLTIGMPGAKHGVREQDPTIAELLKPYGYRTFQVGKNHLGDRNEYLPTVHGFDEFYGNLYHLNAEEEPENADYPKDPAFFAQFGPRGVLHTWATDTFDDTDDPRWGVVGKQKIEDTGPLNVERMKTTESDLLAHSLEMIEKAHKEGKPFFLWHNSTRNHVWIHLNDEYKEKTGYGIFADGMKELDDVVGALLDKLDELGIADNTLVVFSTDNGTEKFSWPQGGTHAFKGEKGLTTEGGMRVPQLARWPGKIKPGTYINDIFSMEDWLPTFLAAANDGKDTGIQEKVRKGVKVGDKTCKAYLDGYNQMDLLIGKGPGLRNEKFYFAANGHLNAIRVGDFKITFTEMWGDLPTAWEKTPSWPVLTNLRQDPYEYFNRDTAPLYFKWWADRMWVMVPAQAVVAKHLASLKEFPPARGSSLSIEQIFSQIQFATPGQ
jgi:arylsulfatase A-like enzyme